MLAMALTVSEKKIFLSTTHYKSMGVIDPNGSASLDPRGLISRIYVGKPLDVATY